MSRSIERYLQALNEVRYRWRLCCWQLWMQQLSQLGPHSSQVAGESRPLHSSCPVAIHKNHFDGLPMLSNPLQRRNRSGQQPLLIRKEQLANLPFQLTEHVSVQRLQTPCHFCGKDDQSHVMKSTSPEEFFCDVGRCVVHDQHDNAVRLPPANSVHEIPQPRLQYLSRGPTCSSMVRLLGIHRVGIGLPNPLRGHAFRFAVTDQTNLRQILLNVSSSAHRGYQRGAFERSHFPHHCLGPSCGIATESGIPQLLNFYRREHRLIHVDDNDICRVRIC